VQPIINEAVTAIIDGEPREVSIVPRTALRRSEQGELEVVMCVAAGVPPTATLQARAQAVTLWREMGAMAAVEGIAAPTQVVVDRALGLEDDTILEISQ
jgi:hypothetical protein